MADKLNIVLNNINELINLKLIGGEVTYYNLIDLFEHHLTCKNIRTLSIITNFSKPVEYFNTLSDYCQQNSIRLSLVISYHPDYVTLHDLIDKLTKLDSRVHISHINYVVTNQNARELDDTFDNLIDTSGQFFSHLQLIKDRRGITTETLDLFKKLIEKHQIQDKNWLVTFDDDSEKKLSRSNCQTFEQSYLNYTCDKVLRLDLDNKFRAGVCSTEIKVPVEEFIYKTKDEIKQFCISKCKQGYCPLCEFNLIYKE